MQRVDGRSGEGNRETRKCSQGAGQQVQRAYPALAGGLGASETPCGRTGRAAAWGKLSVPAQGMCRPFLQPPGRSAKSHWPLAQLPHPLTPASCCQGSGDEASSACCGFRPCEEKATVFWVTAVP